uniref:RNA polymerase alpha subunit n=1 Tax=Phacus pleuronectes TaxID=102908 RepID=A0A3G3LLT9_9EUGL|nr:RNA polymerase alpha subunit [Phacus pleuronectes]AYQ93684.1 RNA polymerase alpha subunit [Phacus pleuronectes]
MKLIKVTMLKFCKAKRGFYSLFTLDCQKLNNLTNLGNLIRRNLIANISLSFKVNNVLFFARDNSVDSSRFMILSEYFPIEHIRESFVEIRKNLENIIFYNSNFNDDYKVFLAYLITSERDRIVKVINISFYKPFFLCNLNHYIFELLVSNLQIKIFIKIII